MTRHAKASSAQSTARSLLVSASLMLVAVLALGASPALGAVSHPYTGVSFGPDGVGGSESFERLQGVAVDPASGDVFAYDGAAGRVYKFNEAGAPVAFSALAGNVIENVGGGGGGAEEEIAIAPPGSPGGTAGDIYVANNSFTGFQVYSPDGQPLGEVETGGETCGVATDPSGNLYAGVYPSTVNKYTPDANPPTTANESTGTVEHGICNVAADGLNNIYAATYNGGLFKLEGIADTTPVEVDPRANTMAIAPGSNDLYADRENEIVQYDTDGNFVGRFAAEDISESHGISVNSDASRIYVSTPSTVRVYGPSSIVPDVVTEAADAITKTSATLHGTISAAGGPESTCVFQYAPVEQFFEHGFQGAAESPCSPAGPFAGSSVSGVSALASGLSGETEYAFRLLGSNENGHQGSETLRFSTPGAVNVQTDAATSITASSARLNGTINPEGVLIEECRFEYGHNESYGESVPCAEDAGAIGTGNSPVAVHADVNGLTGGTNYHFRLVAKNEFGPSQGEDLSLKTSAPSVEAASLVGVSSAGAIFRATVNPNGETTSYYFEYVNEADFNASGYAGAIALPSGGEAIGAGNVGVEVDREATGLSPLTTYHVRVVASNAGGVTVGPDLVFTTYSLSSTGLPDGRVYEQATPIAKNGNNIQGYANVVRTPPSGDGVSFFVNGGLPGGEGGQYFPSFISLRGANQWSTQSLQPPARLGVRGEPLGLSTDFGTAYLKSVTASAPTLTASLYEKDTSTGQIDTIYSGPTIGERTPQFVGNTLDDSEALFALHAALLPGSAEGTEEEGGRAINLYLWDRSSQRLVLASVLNDGRAPTEEGVYAGAYDWFGTGGGSTTFYTQEQNVLTPDGSRVIFTDAESHQIYARTNPLQSQSSMNGEECTEADRACTIEISKSVRTTPDPDGPQPAKFVTATPDGSKVLFMSNEELTDDANTGSHDQSADLYSYDFGTGGLIDLTPSSEAENPEGADVGGVIGSSKDGSYVYFVAGGMLAPGASHVDCPQQNNREGSCNIYVWHAGSISFITRVTSDEAALFQFARNWAPAFAGAYGSPHLGKVSADGNTLLFASTNNLTSYDARGHQEFYRYQVGQDGLVCISCTPSGEPPLGDAALASIYPGVIRPSLNVHGTRNLTADGNRIFFESVDKLVGADTNGTKDVYEWEADGTGSCQSQKQNGGCLFLMSSGTSPSPSYFADASESGDDVYIFTSQPFLGQDRDELVDIYDARVGGGLASQNPPAPSICTGESCRPAATTPPENPTAGTSTFSGPSNEKVKKKKPKKHHKKRHAKKKHGVRGKNSSTHKSGGKR